MNKHAPIIAQVTSLIFESEFIYHPFHLYSFPWLYGAYGLTGPNKMIPRPHIYITVKRGKKHESDVHRDLQYKFKCDTRDYFEILQEPKRKPKVRYLGQCLCKSCNKSIRPVPGGCVLGCINSRSEIRYSLRERENAEIGNLPEVQGNGTLTLFCFNGGHHYALTCSHVGLANGQTCFKSAFNKIEDIQAIRNSLPDYEEVAREKEYWFTEADVSNNNEPTWYGDDGGSYTLLGDFYSCSFNDECDIMSLIVSDQTNVDCKIADATPPDWNRIWGEFYERVFEGTGQDPVRVEKTGCASSLTYGRIIPCDFSYRGESEIFKDAIVVKGYCGRPFLEDGDSGSLVLFHDNNEQKQIFAYAVCEVDDLHLPEQPASSVNDTNNETDNVDASGGAVSDIGDETENLINDSEILFEEEGSEYGPYYICLRLDTALESLGLSDTACVNDCGHHTEA